MYRWEIVNISFFWPNRAELRQITCRLNSLFSDGSQCQIFLPFSSTIAEHKSRICLFFRATTLHKNTNKLKFFIIYHRNKIVWPNKEKNFIISVWTWIHRVRKRLLLHESDGDVSVIHNQINWYVCGSCSFNTRHIIFRHSLFCVRFSFENVRNLRFNKKSQSKEAKCWTFFFVKVVVDPISNDNICDWTNQAWKYQICRGKYFCCRSLIKAQAIQVYLHIYANTLQI